MDVKQLQFECTGEGKVYFLLIQMGVDDLHIYRA
jgi:hypothetical protein